MWHRGGGVTGPKAIAEGGRLDIYANNDSILGRRRARYGLREVLWKASSLDRVRKCGRIPAGSDVVLRHREGLPGLAGLCTCGSVWACPVCASKIRVRRALEIGEVLGEAVRQGYGLGFVTFTVRHRRSDPLPDIWGAVAQGWRRVSTARMRAVDSGRVGWVRVVEVTDGLHGWHVHVHAVVVLDIGTKAVDLDRLGDAMFRRWRRGVESAGFEALRQAQDWRFVTNSGASEALGEYLAKSVETADAGSLGLELTHTMPGRSRSGLKTWPVWRLLEDLERDGEVIALARWREWEAASRGKRMIGWSRGLRDRFGFDAELASDEEIASEELGGIEDDVLRFTGEEWREVVSVRGRVAALLDVATGRTWEASRREVMELLHSWGVSATEVAK